MDLLFHYNQEKKDRSKTKPISKLNINVYESDRYLIFHSLYEFDYNKSASIKEIKFEHQLELNLDSGDFLVKYILINEGLSDDKIMKSTRTEKRNDFKKLFHLVENGFYRGEKRLNYWGVKFTRAKEKINDIFLNKIVQNFHSEFYKKKDYINKHYYFPMFDLIVDFHLDKKNIKGHDSVYFDIQSEYPKKKWLEKNDQKFLPAILDM